MDHPMTVRARIEETEALATKLGFFVAGSGNIDSTEKLAIRLINDPTLNPIAYAHDWLDCLAWLRGYCAGKAAKGE